MIPFFLSNLVSVTEASMMVKRAKLFVPLALRRSLAQLLRAPAGGIWKRWSTLGELIG